jgi:FkbM family methyltransferase
MKILNRELRATELPGKALSFGFKSLTCLCLFHDSISLIRHYLNRSSPKNKRIKFRNGRQIHLSNHDLDIVVLFQVFCERAYRRAGNQRVVLDIGANIGSFALYAAFKGARKVFAFEPNSEAYACLLQNIERNGLQQTVIPFRLAVSGRSNETVRIPIAASPQNRISCADIKTADDKYESAGTISLNDIFAKEGFACVDLLKLDCEGSEYEILAATDPSTFHKIREIVLEYHNDGVDEIVSSLGRHGFHLAKRKRESEKMGMLWFSRA